MRTFIFVITFLAALNLWAIDHRNIATKHLAQHGIKNRPLVVEQNTAKNFFYVAEFVLDKGREYECHVGVVVNKKTGRINVGENDPQIALSYPYVDFYIDKIRKLITICPD